MRFFSSSSFRLIQAKGPLSLVFFISRAGLVKLTEIKERAKPDSLYLQTCGADGQMGLDCFASLEITSMKHFNSVLDY